MVYKEISQKKSLTVGLLGNPNCGKTTLFNALTGSHVKVANWPGVTVERMEGEFSHQNVQIKLVDLPGVYSLDSGSMEEKVSADWLASGEADVVINVVNATALERNLYLTVQLLEHNIPVVVALNLMDVAARQGINIDTRILSEGLGDADVVPVSARKRTGLEMLLDRVVEAGTESSGRENLMMMRKNPTLFDNQNKERKRSLYDERKKDTENITHDKFQNIYQFTETLASRAVTGAATHHRSTDRADRILAHPIWGIPVFCLMMAVVFTLTFTMGDWLKGYLELALDWLMDTGRQLFEQWNISPWVSSLVFDGIVSGVGGILTFLPNLFILYVSLAFWEDSGYMARAAYVMNETMGMLGMTGKAFLPLILGFGCTVPAAAGTGALENQQEKRKVLSLLPFMSCSAKMPIYILFAGAFFGKYAVFVTYVLCVVGAVLGLVLCWAVNRKRGAGKSSSNWLGNSVMKEKGANTNEKVKSERAPVLLIELPDYRMPDARTVSMYVWEKVKDYLDRAGTVIFVASMVLWFMLGYGPGRVAETVEESFAALLGRLLVPIFEPAGFGLWQLAVALICGLSAKEVVVSAAMVLFRIEEMGSLAGSVAFQTALMSAGLTPAGALAFLVFCLLYSPCMAAVAAIRKESGSAVWTAGLVVKQTVLAWVAAVAVYWVAGMCS